MATPAPASTPDTPDPADTTGGAPTAAPPTPASAPSEAEAALARLEQKLLAWEREHHVYHRGGDATDVRIDAMVRYFRDQSVRAYEEAHAFREDLITHLRALVIVGEGALSAGTHREKDARLRGLISVVDAGIDRLREYRFKSERSWHWPDVFRSDYPVRRYIDRIRELEQQVEQLTPKDEPSPLPDEEQPF